MKLKLDENLGSRCIELLRNAGHDVATVAGEGLQSTEDSDLLDRCRAEGRALISLDLDFANPLQFRPSHYPGIAVIRLPRRAGKVDLIRAMQTLIHSLTIERLDARLWSVESGRIRIHQEPD